MKTYLSLTCQSDGTNGLHKLNVMKTAKQYTDAERTTVSKKVNEFLDRCFEEQLSRHPEMASSLGSKAGYDRWDDRSDAAADEDLKIAEARLEQLRRDFPEEALNEAVRLSVTLFSEETARRKEERQWRHYDYELTQMGGVHTNLPAFLINVHKIDTVADAESYLKRLQGLSRVFDQTIVNLKKSEAIGVIPPRFTFAYVTHDLESFIAGCEKKDTDNILLTDFSAKVNALHLSQEQQEHWIRQAQGILKTEVKSAYKKMLDYWTALEPKAKAKGDNGAWNLPNGADYYAYVLRWHTTLPLKPGDVFEKGKSEVARIQQEMNSILKKVKYTGSLRQFFDYVRTDKQFKYTQDEQGKAQVLADAHRYIDCMYQVLPNLFHTLPKAALVVKQVEPFREKSAGGAFYEDPAVDGSRPGRYYVNTFNMDYEPKYQMEALTYHEAVPGHHLQIAIAQELNDIPRFRRHLFFTSYIEGWALYAEKLGKEVGKYEDPYSDFGRLSMELFRAARLVVDVGIHYKQWTRSQAIAYYTENTANAKGDIESEIERYFIWPGQATAYKTGMMTIEALRTEAQKKLGGKFDLREFHDVVLTHGAVSLPLLERLVEEWVQRKKS